ncbi:PEPxxWA-CTERM sorting domain-containing protein [Azohydromonas aeria]|uniref:PEPxxWA-CTERM sorting domain-containing protein n=1 Tax=Azohydromonas aeria TaxID=2590212 RepID=UPI0018E05161|nr:PEPxxWA-CTERM sorting domain-containing protein [Azohydromonas aeria]
MPASIAPWLLAALATLPAAALAKVRGSVQLSHFGWSLIDLRPDDGIAPGLGIFPGGSRAAFEASVHERRGDANGNPLPGDDGESRRERDIIEGLFLPTLQASAALPRSGATVRMGGAAADRAFSLLAQGHAGSTPDDTGAYHFLAQGTPAAVPDPAGNPALVLTPYTRLVWTGDLSMALSHEPFLRGGRSESAQGSFQAWLVGPGSKLIDHDAQQLNLNPRDPAAKQRDRRVRLDWINDGAEAASAWMLLSVHVAGSSRYAPGPPIPEPATWALLAGGLGVVGLAARRRKTCSSA